MRFKLPELSRLQAAMAMTLVAAVLLYGWWNQDALLQQGWEELGGEYGSFGYWVLVVLIGFVAWGSAAGALACWLGYLRQLAKERRRPGPGAGPSPDREATVDGPSLHFAKWTSLVAGILIAVPTTLLSYWGIVPRNCNEEACLGSVYLWLFFATIAVVGVIVAVIAWSIYFVGGRNAGERITGLWSQVLIVDGLLLVAAVVVYAYWLVIAALLVLGPLAALGAGVYLLRRHLKRDSHHPRSG